MTSSVSNIKFIVFQAFENIDVIHNYFFEILYVVGLNHRPSHRDALIQAELRPDKTKNTKTKLKLQNNR